MSFEAKMHSAYPAVGPDDTQAGGTYVNLAMTEAVVDGTSSPAPACRASRLARQFSPS